MPGLQDTKHRSEEEVEAQSSRESYFGDGG
jgi:hypothetical protein